MTHTISRLTLFACAAALVTLAGASPAVAQVPDEFTNLKVFPKDIGKQELVGVMRAWAGALGQRCNFCHPGPDDLRGTDFASDESEHKKIARQMAQMVGEINGKLLPASDSDEMRVTCVTCHHGLKEPKTINAIVLGTIDSDGVAAALDEYAELREANYGRGRYDFGSGPLNSVAEVLARERSDVDGALAVMEANIGYNADEAYPLMMVAQLYMAKGDPANAKKSLEKAIAIEPDNDRAKRLLKRIEQSQAGD